jgi:hypothetical protein
LAKIERKAHLLEEKPVSFFWEALQTESNSVPGGIFGSGIDTHFFQPVSKEPKSERFDLASSFFLRLAVAHQTGKCRDFGNPPAIIFLLKLNLRSCHAVDLSEQMAFASSKRLSKAANGFRKPLILQCSADADWRLKGP